MNIADDQSFDSSIHASHLPSDRKIPTGSMTQVQWETLGTCEELLSSVGTARQLVKSLSSSIKWQTPAAGVMIPRMEVATASLRVRGEDIASNDEYWDYSNMSVIKVYTAYIEKYKKPRAE